MKTLITFLSIVSISLTSFAGVNYLPRNQVDIKGLEVGLTKQPSLPNTGFNHVSFEGQTRLGFNKNIFDDCALNMKKEKMTLKQCREMAMVPTLNKSNKIDSKRISFKIIDALPQPEILACLSEKIISANDSIYKKISDVLLEDPSKTIFPIVYLSCECEPTEMDIIGGDFCGQYFFDYSTGKVGNLLNKAN